MVNELKVLNINQLKPEGAPYMGVPYWETISPKPPNPKTLKPKPLGQGEVLGSS